MSSVAQSKPEQRYKKATDPKERRRLATAVVLAYRPHVARLVRKTVPAKHWREAEQVGEIGLLVALEKFDPERGAPFWALAKQWVRHEIQKWLYVGVYWRPRYFYDFPSHRNQRSPKVISAELAEAKRHQRPLLVAQFGNIDDDLIGPIENPPLTVEDLVSDAEAKSRLRAFIATLSEEDARLLLCEKRERVEGGVESANNARARHYQLLVERARAFVRGDDGDGCAPPVRRNR